MRGLASPCSYRHSSKDLSCVVYGDDFEFAGVETNLQWARREMEKSFLIKVIGRLGATNKTRTSYENSIGSVLEGCWAPA